MFSLRRWQYRDLSQVYQPLGFFDYVLTRWRQTVQGCCSVRNRAALALGTPFLVEAQIRIHRSRRGRRCRLCLALESELCRTSLYGGFESFRSSLIGSPLLFSGRQRAFSIGAFLARVVVG